MDFLEHGTAITSERYIATLKTLKQWLRRVPKPRQEHFASAWQS